MTGIFLQGYSHPREYIVTEWVLPPSVADLWSLVYDYDCAAVVVLCNPDASPVSAAPSCTLLGAQLWVLSALL